MRVRRRPAHRIALGAALVATLVLGGAVGHSADTPGPWVEDFRSGRLDPARWERTHDGDFREWSVEVVDSIRRRGASSDPAVSPLSPIYRLRLRADTRGTRDDTVKFLGARAVPPIPLQEGREIVVQLDWGNQSNGSYLTAAVVLSPHVTSGNPLTTDDWLSVTYVGVPPGRNGRLVVAVKSAGRERTVETEGWPDNGRQGRPLGIQVVRLGVRNRAVEVWEGDRRVLTAARDTLAFDTAYLYLQMSSHSNYPPRSIYFDTVRID
jgi:hypothetical protein